MSEDDREHKPEPLKRPADEDTEETIWTGANAFRQAAPLLPRWKRVLPGILAGGLATGVMGLTLYMFLRAPAPPVPEPSPPPAPVAEAPVETAAPDTRPAAEDPESTGSIEPASAEQIAEYCGSALPRNAIVVETREADVGEVHDDGIEHLTESGGHQHSGVLTLGTTTSRYSYKLTFKVTSQAVPNTLVTCSRVSVRALLEIPYHRVSIARQLTPGSCAFEAVRKHEYKHVAINVNTLHSTAASLEAELKERFDNDISYEAPAAFSNQIQQEMAQRWQPRVKELEDEGQVAHQAVDTPEEYARTMVVCGGEIPRIISKDLSLKSVHQPL